MHVDDTLDNAGECSCPDCPSFDGEMAEEGEALFCARGESACEPATLGCVCAECAVALDYELSGDYYCQNGMAE